MIFRERRYLDKCWTHDFDDLMEAATLEIDWKRDTAAAANPIRNKYRMSVDTWAEHTRYEIKSEFEARELFEAVTDPSDGVLQWIKSRW